ncbi:MAG TPA: hypothetical protein VGD59_14590 [Acidisarcina sp.]
MHLGTTNSFSRIVLFTVAAGLAAANLNGTVSAQDAPAAAPAPSAPAPLYSPTFPTKYFEFYAGYSYFRPVHASLTTDYASGPSVQANYGSSHSGSVASISYFFNEHVGVQVEGGLNPDGENDGFWTGQAGLVIHKPSHMFQPFGHFLFGATEVAGPNGFQDRPYYHRWTWKQSVLAGGGVDYELPFYNHHFSVRMIQADYNFVHPDFGTQLDGTGGNAGISAFQLTAGLVFHPGWTPVPVTYACAANPAAIYPGDPVTVTGTATGLNPKKKATYTWSGPGLTIKGDGPSGTIDTGSLAPGTFPISGHVSEGKKPGMMADCSTSLTVKPFEPPTLTCSADPSSVATGGTSTITASGTSPQNRLLTYTFSASTGQISGTGNTATLSVGGAPAGSITVTCNVADDKGGTASATATVNVTVPTPPEVKHVVPQCQDTPAIGFTDPQRPARVNNEAKACLDAVTLSAKTQSDATVVIVGEQSSSAHPGLAAQRAANTKQFLTTDEGIDASRVSIRTGTADKDTVEAYLVPAGANFDADVMGTTAVDDSVKPQVRKPLHMRKHGHHGHKHSHKKKAMGS